MLDTSYLLTKIKLIGSVPEGRYTDAEILDLANDVMMAHVIPLIISLKEEYYVQSEDQDITADVSAYPIPYRAMGLSLREVKKVVNSSIIDLPRMSPEDIKTAQTGSPRGFYIEAQNIVLYPTPASTQDKLRLYYFRTPSKPVATTDCAIITSIDTGTGIITATPPTTWTAASEMDLVSRRNGHKCLATDIVPSSISSTTITFNTSDLPATLSIGDYVCLAGEAPYVQVPDVCFDLVVRLVVNELLESMGDQEALHAGMAKVEALKSSIVGLLTNRVTGALKRSRISLI